MSDILNTSKMHPRDQIALVMRRIYDRVLTTTSGGNISVIDESGEIWITPAGVDKGLLKPSDIVCVKPDGTVIGEHKPSSEYPFHKAIYEVRPDIKSIIHAHPPALVAFSIVRQTPNTNILPQSREVCGAIGYAPYKLPGTVELGESIALEFKKGLNAVIMENHGIVVGGTDLLDTFQRFETLEVSARTILYGNMIGEPSYLSDAQIEAYQTQLPAPLPEIEHCAYPPDEREKRLEICKIVKRACKQGLMLSAYGTVSTRWRGNDFLITPANISRSDLQIEDIVQIKDGQREKGKIPAHTAYLHQAIYNKCKDVNAIIVTQAPYIMAFSVTNAPYDVRTIPETWIYLQDVKVLDFGAQFEHNNQVIENVSTDNPVVIVRNECVVVTGNKLLQAFDYLEVSEFSAKSLVLSKSIGKMVPINDEQVSELGKVMGRWKNYDWRM